jgi:hypothetical protein
VESRFVERLVKQLELLFVRSVRRGFAAPNKPDDS